MSNTQFQRAKEIFVEALALPTDQRQAFITTACGDDAALLREVQELLGAQDEASDAGFLNPSKTTMAEDPHQPIGTKVGRYKLLQLIGEGGFGSVYMAEQERPVVRRVAVKIIKLGMDSRAVVARFEAERQALALMDHPNIARVLDAGTTGTGRPYFVMELVKGDPITDYADRNHLDVSERLELFTQVCHAVQHAHQKGIVHRDIKPNNILVGTQDGRPFAKVIDFGIAKAMAARLTEKTLFTEFKQLIGTPQYMSPEQADGSIDIDTRTDIYSLGVLLYELLTGSTPFDAKDLRGAAYDEMRRIIREVEPPRPSTRLIQSANTIANVAAQRKSEPKKLGNIVRGELDWIVMRALEKDRARRYETPTALAEDVGRYLNGTPIHAAPPSWGYKATKFVSKYKAPISVGVVLVATLLIAFAVVAMSLVQARRALAGEQLATAKASDATRSALLEAYVANIGAAQVAVVGESWPEARQRLDACPESLRGWEWRFLRSLTSTPEFGLSELAFKIQLSANDRLLLCQDGLNLQVFDLQQRRRNWGMKCKELRVSAQNLANYTVPAIIGKDGRVAVQLDDSVAVYGLNGEERNRLRPSDKGSSFILSMRFSPRGKFLLVQTAEAITLQNLETNSVQCELPAAQGGIGWSSDDTLLAIQQKDKSIGLIDARTGKERRTLSPSQGVAGTFEFSPDAKSIVLGTDQGLVEVFDVATGKRLASAPDAAPGMVEVVFSPDGQFLLCPRGKDGCRILDAATLKVVSQTALPTWATAKFSTDGSLVLDASTPFLWDWKRGADPDATRRPFNAENMIAFSGDGSFAISHDNYRVRFWKTDAPSRHRMVMVENSAGSEQAVVCTTFGGRDIALGYWDQSQGADMVLAALENIPATETPDASVQSPDGQWNASASGTKSVTVRNLKDASQPAVTLNHEAQVRAMTFSRDGSRLVTGSDGGTLRFWDTGSWRELAIVHTPSPVVKLAFTQDGTRLAIASADKALRLWDSRSDDDYTAAVTARRSERATQKPFVEQLVSSNIPRIELGRAVTSNTSLTPAQKVAALEELDGELESAQQVATAEFEKLKALWFIKPRVESEADKLGLPRAVRKAMDRNIANWRQDARVVNNAAFQIIKQQGLPIDRYRAARDAAESIVGEVKDDSAIRIANTIGIARYRCGDFNGAIKVLQDDLAATHTKPLIPTQKSANLTYIAASQFKLGRVDEAKKTLQSAIDLQFANEGVPYLAEVAGMIDPPSTQPTILSASDSANLRSLFGQKVRVRGKVIRIAEQTNGGANIVLDSETNGMILWVTAAIRKSAFPDEAYFNKLVGKEVIVGGTVRNFGGPQPEWKEWVQIGLARPAQIQVVGEQQAQPANTDD